MNDIDRMIFDLQELADTKGLVLYNICFRHAGVGFQWYDKKKANKEANIEYNRLGLQQNVGLPHTVKADNFENYIYITNYYSTIAEAIDAETERLKDV